MNSHAIATLIEKRAKLSGLIVDLERELAQHRASLTHLDATLKLLDPTIKLHHIRAKQPAASRSGYFNMGELSQRCKEGIREAGEQGVSAEELALKAMADKGIPEGDKELRMDFIRRFHWSLGRLQRDGRIDRLGYGRGVRWRQKAE